MPHLNLKNLSNYNYSCGIVSGFGLFKMGQRVGYLKDFTVAENVIVQTTAVATATMPLAAGFVGVVPALT